MSGDDWVGVIFGFGFLVLATAILIVVLHHLGKYLQARGERASESRYVALTESYEDLAGGLRTSQASTAETLEDIRARLTEIERMLREVE